MQKSCKNVVMLRLDPDGKPMMSDAEISIVEALLKKLPEDARVLEWGSGNSTPFFAKQLDPKKSLWLSVEHNGNYIKELSHKSPFNVHFVWAPEDDFYVDCVKLNRNSFDLVIVDGMDKWRERCVAEAFDMLTPDGVILLHDSGRPEYRKWIQKYPHEQLIEGEVPVEGGFAHRGLVLFRKPI